MLSPNVEATVGINSIIENILACRKSHQGIIYVDNKMYLKVGEVYDRNTCPQRDIWKSQDLTVNLCGEGYLFNRSETGG